MQFVKRSVLVIGILGLCFTLMGCSRYSNSHLVLGEIRKITEADAIYGKKTDISIQIHSPVANASITVKTDFRNDLPQER